jgi:hypothetical protein
MVSRAREPTTRLSSELSMQSLLAAGGTQLRLPVMREAGDRVER